MSSLSSSSSSWTEYRKPPEPFTSSPLRTSAAAAAAAAKPQSSWSALVTKTTISPGDDDDDRKGNDNNIHYGMTIIPPLPLYDTSSSIQDEGYTTTHTTTTAATAMSTIMDKSQPTIIPSSQHHLLRRSATTNAATAAKVGVPTISNINRKFHRYDSAPLSSSSSSTTAATKNNTITTTSVELDNIVHTLHQHSKLDCPTTTTNTQNNSETIVYSCLVNGCTPLGMEYISDLIVVTNLDYLLTGTTITTATTAAAAASATTTTLIEYVSLIIVKLNQASLEYNQTTTATTTARGGECDDDDDDGLHTILSILELGMKDCHEAMEIINNTNNNINKINSSTNNNKVVTGGGGKQCNSDDEKGGLCVIVNLLLLLEVMVHSNIGTVNYRLNNIRESLTSYENAMAILDRYNSSSNEEKWHVDDADNELYHNNNDNRIPSRDFLLLVLRMNLSRVLLRLKRPDDAAKYRDMICMPPNNDRLQQQHRKTKVSLLLHQSRLLPSSTTAAALLAHEHDMDRRINWLHSVSEHYITGLIYETKGTTSEDYKLAYQHYNHLLSIARVKLDHRHPYICTLLERRGAVLFEQRKLQCSMLSYLACLKIIEYQQSTQSKYFTIANLSRILYAVARVLHDKEEYHDALHIYQRALKCQRLLVTISRRSTTATLDVITTLCNISRVHHLSGEIDAALSANREVLELTLTLVGGRTDHPFLIHRLKFEGNILVEAGRLDEAMQTFVNAARRCGDDGRDRMMTEMMGGGPNTTTSSVVSSQEDADAGDSSVLSIRSAAALAQLTFFHPAAASA
jgi:tetratricopeptide (TPR) repeat protein